MMSSKRIFYVLIAVCVLLIAGMLFATYQGAALLQAKGDSLLELKLENEVLADKQLELVQARKDIQTYAELESIAKSIVPQEKDQARTIREIVAIADESGVPLSTIQFPESALGVVQKKSSSKKSVDSTTSQLTAVEGTKGLYAMQITVTSNPDEPVKYSQMLDMLRRLEQNRRTAHVTNLSITPSETDRNAVTFTLTVTVFIKP
jgi:hypothetical protein